MLADWDLTGLLAPGNCLHCEAVHGAPLCSACLTQLDVIAGKGCRTCGNPDVHRDAEDCEWCRRLKHTPDEVCTLYSYRDTGRQVFHLIKYQSYWRLAPILFEDNLAPLFTSMYFTGFDCLVPIPESFSRKLRRHFNPAAVVAEALSQRTGLPIRPLLKTGLFHRHQVGLDLTERRRNARDRYQVTMQAIPESVILVDDVLTTGATMEAATQVLLKAGVKKIGWFSLFRTP